MISNLVSFNSFQQLPENYSEFKLDETFFILSHFELDSELLMMEAMSDACDSLVIRYNLIVIITHTHACIHTNYE